MCLLVSKHMNGERARSMCATRYTGGTGGTQVSDARGRRQPQRRGISPPPNVKPAEPLQNLEGVWASQLANIRRKGRDACARTKPADQEEHMHAARPAVKPHETPAPSIARCRQ